MKNAKVLVHHFGDDGDTPEGKILLDISNKRFDHLEGQGLVREATPEEVGEGYVPAFTVDTSDQSLGDDLFDVGPTVVELQREMEEMLVSHNDRLKVQLEHGQVVLQELEEIRSNIDKLKADHATVLDAERERADAAEKSLADAQVTIAALQAAALSTEAGEKQAEEPANKAAPTPANKSK